MRFAILGPLEVRDGTTLVPLAGGKQRALLARLLLDANRVVPAERLVEDLWGVERPETAAKMVQVYVSQLRKALPSGRLATRAPGYALRVEDDEIDLDRFERLRRAARDAHAAGDAERAARFLREALELWRGPALAEFSEPFAEPEHHRLEELRLAALEERIDADLATGDFAGLAGEVEVLIARHPLRERLRGLQMRALDAGGRQAEALAAFQEFRRLLADELGLEPSAELRQLERSILQRDEDRTPAPARAPAPPARASPPQPPVRFARSGDASIAYQVVGDGPLDVVLVHGWICTFYPGWEDARIAGFYRRLASLGRLILFDKRGTGLSDRVEPDRLPDLETRMDDVRAVMDAAGSERAAVVGVSEGGPMSLVFAASHPDRASALVLLGTFARLMWAPDYTLGQTPAQVAVRQAVTESEDWAREATTEWLGRVAPAVLDDDERFEWYVSYVMRGSSAAGARALRRMNEEIDVRDVLPAVAIPTLVAWRADEWHAAASRYLAERIPGARTAELPGGEHLPWEGDQEALVGAIDRFLADVDEDVAPDRILVTVLFTDIVGSTQTLAEVGDRHWRSLLERHDAVVRNQIARFRGREVDRAGDGVLAVFDGPARAVRCATALMTALRPLGLELRAGIHTGEVEVADGRVAGLAVHIGARIAALAGAGEVLVSQTVRDLVAGSGIELDDRGAHELRGVPGEWRLLAVRSAGG